MPSLFKIFMAIMVVVSSFPYTGEAARRGKISINVSPKNFQFEVNSRGDVLGKNKIRINVSRSDPPSGILKRCKKIKGMMAEISKLPGEVDMSRTPYPSQRHKISTVTMSKALCSFSNIPISGYAFTSDMVRAACKGSETRNVSLVKSIQVLMWPLFYNGGNGIIYGEVSGERAPVIRARIRCPQVKQKTFQAFPVEPTAKIDTQQAQPSSRGEKLFAQCIDQNRGVAVQVDMTRGIGKLYLKGNSVFNLTTKYLSIRGSTPDNLIELKGNGFRKMYLNKGRKILYFRDGNRGEFCKVRIQRR